MGYDAREFDRWKCLVPYLYDWLTNHDLLWPSQCCRWGPKLNETEFRSEYRVYLSEQTDGSAPNQLVIGSASVVKNRVAAAESIASFSHKKNVRSPFYHDERKIVHHGEVNKIRELPSKPEIVFTHSDTRDVYCWNVEGQTGNLGEEGRPALLLKGHEDIAPFALGTSSSPGSALVASGGKDALVCVWNLRDHMASLGAPAEAGKPGVRASWNSGGPGTEQKSELGCQVQLKGHTSRVEDLVFKPGSDTELASVADDHKLILWDTRKAASPAVELEEAHSSDVQCVDWSPLDSNLVVTGAADSSLHTWDLRALHGPVASFRGHKGSILRVQWSPDSRSVFASGGEDALLNVWDLDKASGPSAGEGGGRFQGAPEGLLFQHCGHRGSVVDFQWNPSDPWTMMSMSDDAESGGGGTMQIWRINDMIYRPEEEVLRELEQHRDFILTGRESMDE
mmetsp:Transcript_12527/g.35394  ORF Transcript_12527/g.35394 Transcript_12527/m.35394 type:complete len:451 (-) Transcript_12527:1274-2626(-)